MEDEGLSSPPTIGGGSVKFQVGDSALSVTEESGGSNGGGSGGIGIGIGGGGEDSPDNSTVESVGEGEIEPMNEEDKRYFEALHTSDRIGNYVLGRTLGEGAFAKVKLATHTVSGMQVAVKIVIKSKIHEPYVRKHLRREGRIMRTLRHPHIVGLYEIIETDRAYCLVTEVASGGEVLDYIVAHGTLPEKEVRKFVRQLIQAVDHLHQCGVVHRDLKAENLLLDENLDIKLIDFGLSNIAHSNVLATQCGSPAYTAPELLGGKDYGHPVDVWSIGINMYAMLTGRLPFASDNVTRLHALILDQNYVMPENITPECKDLLSRLLQVKPKDRITIAELRTHPWICLNEQPLQAETAPPALTRTDINDAVVNQVTKLGYSMEEVMASVLESRCDSLYAIYHLLVKRNKQRSSSSSSSSAHPERKMHRVMSESGMGMAKEFVQPTRPPRRGELTHSFSMRDTASHGGASSSSSSSSRRASISDSTPRRRLSSRDLPSSTPGSCSTSTALFKLTDLKEQVAVSGPFVSASNPPSRPLSRGASSVKKMSPPKYPGMEVEETIRRLPSISAPRSGVLRPSSRSGSSSSIASAGTTPPSSSFMSLNRLSGGGGGGGGGGGSASGSLGQGLGLSQQYNSISNNNNNNNNHSSSNSGISVPKSMRCAMSKETVSSQNPQTVLERLQDALEDEGVDGVKEGANCIRCNVRGVQFAAEVVKVPGLDMNAVHFRRIRGDAEEYRALCRNLLEKMKLQEH